MAPFLLVFFLISKTRSTPTISPTTQLSCLLKNGSTATCTSYCGAATEETIFIGVKNPVCPEYILDTDLTFSTTITEADNGECIKQEMGCGNQWLCQVISDQFSDNGPTCSTADLLFNIWELKCTIDAPKVQYTQFKLQQICCTTNDCSDTIPNCKSNKIYKTYTNDLYHCYYSQSAIDNKYENVRKCNDSFNTNDFSDVCEYLISKTYSIYGCKCKSSHLIGHKLQNETYNALISDWNNNEMQSYLESLRKYGCATNMECIANDRNDEVFVGGLLNIYQTIYTVKCEVFVPYQNINKSAIDHIEGRIDHDKEKIYVTFSDDEDDPHSLGRVIDIFVVYFFKSARDIKYDTWTEDKDWFGGGSEIQSVEKNDINETLSYYGADEYYQRGERHDAAGIIAGVVLAVTFGLVLILIFIYSCQRTE